LRRLPTITITGWGMAMEISFWMAGAGTAWMAP
jgi:hypothetical protein